MKRSYSSAMRRPIVPIPPILPVGFRFNPTDEELIGYYLVMLLQGLYCDDMPIGIVNFLEFEPWELPGRSKVESQEQVWYFFSHRDVYMSGNEKKYKRKTRAGRWSSTAEPMIIDNLGKRNTLRFYKDSPKQMTEWLAYEYEITPTSILPNPDEFVIIKLMISPPTNSSREKRTKMKINTKKQKLQKTLTSADDGSISLDEVMTMPNCCSHKVSTDFGNQNEANTTVQQCIQEDTVRDLIPTISNSSYVVSSNYGHENPKEMAIMSTYETGESSSRATSGCQNHSSVSVVQEQSYCHTRFSPYILENQENCILASDFENQKLPSEVENCPTKATLCTADQYENPKLPSGIEDSPSQATPYTKNQFTTDETNLSCSTTPRLEDHSQNKVFNSSFLEDGDFCSQIDLDALALADMEAFHELLNSLNPTTQHATSLGQCM